MLILKAVFCIVIGFYGGFTLASVLNANADKAMIKKTYLEGMEYFAKRLKEKVQKPEFPWEDFFVCESDIDELLEEMVGEVK